MEGEGSHFWDQLFSIQCNRRMDCPAVLRGEHASEENIFYPGYSLLRRVPAVPGRRRFFGRNGRNKRNKRRPGYESRGKSGRVRKRGMGKKRNREAASPEKKERRGEGRMRDRSMAEEKDSHGFLSAGAGKNGSLLSSDIVSSVFSSVLQITGKGMKFKVSWENAGKAK